jgi:L-ascorbate metabolism protein UlaG (beta-lactamase superfamily)
MIYKDVGAKFMMPMHYGTLFYGSDSNPNEPMERLLEIAAREGLSEKIVGLGIGEQRVLF